MNFKSIKNLLLRAALGLHKSLFSSAPSSGAQKRFLIVSTTGLGDTLWATPAIRFLRQHFPKAYLSVLTSPLGKQLLEHSPYIDEIFVLNTKLLSLLSLYSTLKKRSIDTALIFHASQRVALPLCQLIGAKEIIGSESINKGLDHVLTIPLPFGNQHEILRRLEIVSAIPDLPPKENSPGGNLETGCRSCETEPRFEKEERLKFYSQNDLSMEIFLEKKDHEEAAAILQKHNLANSVLLIGLHPGAKDSYKQWPPDNFIALGRKLAQEQKCRILVTGIKEEAKLTESIASQIPNAVSLAGELSVRGTAALIQKLALLITNDTGPLHLSLAVKRPTLAFFSPTDPSRCGPLFSTHSSVIAKPPTCTPCVGRKCKNPICLLQISPEEATQKALSLLAQTTNRA